MALKDFFRGDRRDRDEHTRYPLDPLSRESWHEDSEARFGADQHRNYNAEQRRGPGSGRFRSSRDSEYGGSSNNPFYGEHPLTHAGSSYDADYFGSKNGLPTTQWRRDAGNEQFDDLVYGGRSSDPYSAPVRGEFSGRGPRGYRRSDERIREDVCQCLTDDQHVDASEIEVTVNDREVTLTGTVTSRMQKRHAEDLTERLPGVRDVINSLRVTSQTQSSQGTQTSGTQSTSNQSTRMGGQIR